MGSYVLVVVLLLCFGFSYGFVPFSQPISLTGPRYVLLRALRITDYAVYLFHAVSPMRVQC